MKINRLTLPLGKEEKFITDLDFYYYHGDPFHVAKILSCHLDLRVTNYDDLVVLSFKIKGEIETTCAYSLEAFNYPYDIQEVVELSDNEDDDYKIRNNEIDIDEIVITLIVSHIPLKLVKPGAKLPENGEGYRVMKEEDAEKERKSSPFDELDDLEFED